MAYYKTLEYKVFNSEKESKLFCRKVNIEVIHKEVNDSMVVVFYYETYKTSSYNNYNYNDYNDYCEDEMLYVGGETYFRDSDGVWKKKLPKKDERFYSDLFKDLV